MLTTTAPPAAARNADAVISTLVLEHIPLEAFFSVAAALLVMGGHLLVTNMHAEMGARSQAGFVDIDSGEKVRPVSHAHSIEDVLRQAARCGFRVVGEVREGTVEGGMVERIGKRAEKWVGVRCWFGVMLQKSVVEEDGHCV